MNTRYLALELRRLLRSSRFTIFTLAMPAVLLLVYTGLYGGAGAVFPNGIPVTTALMINMATYAAMTAPLFTGTRVATERGLGWQRQLRLTPLSSPAYLLTKGLTALLIAVPGLVLVGVIGALVADVRLSAGQWVAVLGGVWLAAIPVAMLGLVIGLLSNQDTVQPIGSGLMMLFGLLGGVWVPAEAAPDWMRQIMQLMPTYWMNQVAKAPLLADPHLGQAVLVLAGWAAVLAVVGARRFRTATAR